MFQPIDQMKTGIKLEILIRTAGYEVKDIQAYLHLSCPQSIYRWFKGKILPSVEHLYALSKLLNVHMEDLLVAQGQPVEDGMMERINDATTVRLLAYRKRIREAA
ncbi:MAG: helix-turn-helix domain-containing protein [Lachnospiraceae bacterium]|nr:helix-turn-helix domain-containing protein [Lachnospiraceae bacterium]